jgi:hypothetical protein
VPRSMQQLRFGPAVSTTMIVALGICANSAIGHSIELVDR